MQDAFHAVAGSFGTDDYSRNPLKGNPVWRQDFSAAFPPSVFELVPPFIADAIPVESVQIGYIGKKLCVQTGGVTIRKYDAFLQQQFAIQAQDGDVILHFLRR